MFLSFFKGLWFNEFGYIHTRSELAIIYMVVGGWIDYVDFFSFGYTSPIVELTFSKALV